MFFLVTAACVRAEDVSAVAILSDAATEVGQPVQLQVKIAGGKDDEAPEIKVDGLDIAYHGASLQSSFNFINGRLTSSSSVVHNYSVTPLHGGDFTIPALKISVGGKTVATQPVTLSAGGGAAAGAQGGASSGGGNALAFGEIILPKQDACVGEVVPVELRFYVDSRVRWETQQPPKLEGEGFTAQKMTTPQQSTVTKDGRKYDLVIFKTTVTPAKAGKLALGPVELQALAQLPQPKKRQRRARGPFDDFFGGDPFEDMFGSMPVTQQIGIRGAAAELDVKPLPPGAPGSFTGAVGVFKMTASADPAGVKVGDPVTLKLAVSGRGNFDRVGAPLVTDEKGWRSYPPTAEFKQDDDVGMSGRKTFSFAMIPSEKKTALPAVEFSYFDPERKKYVTLNGGRIAVAVSGEEASAPAVAQTGPAATPATTPAAQPAPAATDIHYIRTDEGKWGLTFEPPCRRRGFWLAQLAPLGALLAFVALQILKIRAGNVRACELAELKREKARLMETLRRRDVAAKDFYDAAARFAQLEAAARLDRNPASIDANDAASLPGLDDGTAGGVRAIFAARDELLYAGRGASGGGGADAETRERVMKTLQAMEVNHE